jgi:hypothetical protein
MKEKWTNDLQKKMANYEVPTIPEGLWEDIDAALETNTHRLSPITQYWRKACAAILLLLLIPTTLYFFYNDKEEKALVEANSIGSIPEKTSPTATSTTHDSHILANKGGKPASSPNYVSKPCLVLPQNPEAPATKEEQKEQANQTEEQEQTTTRPTPQPTTQAPQSTTASAQPSVESPITAQAQQSENTPLFKEKKQEDIYLAMNASGINISNGDPSSDGEMTYFDPDGNPPTYNINDPYSYQSYHEEKHHRPITIGLQVGIPVAKDWSFVTGLTYTYLHSEFKDRTSMGYTLHTDQNLHFIGVPVQMNYQLYNNRYCNIYLGAGGRADFGISGKTDKESHLSNLPVNYSLKAAAGVQVNIFKSLNIYAEPTIQYNIPGSTRYKTYYTEHKTMLDLQFGIRFTP